MRRKEGLGPVPHPHLPHLPGIISHHTNNRQPGIAPCPVPVHITALSQAGSLSSTHLLFGVLSIFSLPFLVWTTVSSRQTTASPVKSVPHQTLTEWLMCPPILPHHWHQQVGVLNMQQFLKGRFNFFPQQTMLNFKGQRYD